MKKLSSNPIEDTNALLYSLKGLQTIGTVLHIAAHPDDEDIGLLSYISHKYGAKAVYWSATRGEAGQNRIAPYLDTELGVFRSWEANNARAIDGGTCLYGPFIDFGYTKTAAECLQKWGKTEVLKEMVRVIRAVQPQIIVSRWRGVADDFHGHHQAVGLVTYDAFEAAGDPNQFPELIQDGLAPWQPQKFYYSCNNSGGDQSAGGALNLFGHRNPDYETDGIVCINTGELDPIAGMTYQEQAWLAYNQHQSQGMGVIPKPGDFCYYFSLHKSLVPTPNRETDLYDGLDSSLTGLADYPGQGSQWLRTKLLLAKEKVQDAMGRFACGTIEVAEPLLEGLVYLRELQTDLPTQFPDDDRRRQALDRALTQKIQDFETLICHALGLRLECLTDDGRVTPGQQFQCDLHLWNHRNLPLDSVNLTLHLPPEWQQQPQDAGATASSDASASYQVTVDRHSTMSCPYWLSDPPNHYRYQWPQGYVGEPFNAPLMGGTCEIVYQQQRLTLQAPALFREKFMGGSRALPLAVIPPISLHPANQETILLDAHGKMQALELSIVARSNMEHHGVNGRLRLEVPAGWQVEPADIDLAMGKVGSAQTLTFKVVLPENTLTADYVLRYVISVDGRDYDVVLNPVRMATPGLPGSPSESNCIQETYILKPATINVKVLDVKFEAGLRYGYVEGIAEKIRASLTSFGIDFHGITDAEMGFIDLQQFDAIVIGPNAYVVRESLRKCAQRFLDYVERGGTLIVQYQGYAFEGKGFTPYPFKFNQPHDRVSIEEDPSPEILQPDHFLANYPNQMSEESFLGWKQDVGLYFFGEWDERYESVFSCHDPGEDPKHGCLVIASYGRGTYVYTGFTFFRQLPAGHLGAFRLFANLLAVPMARRCDRTAILQNIPLFSLMDDEQLAEVAQVISECRMERDAYVFRQGDRSEQMYILTQGAIEILKGTQKDPEQNAPTMTTVEPGSILGEMEAIANLPRSTSARIREDAHLLVIDRDRLRKLMHDRPEIADRVLSVLATHIVSP